jgi:arylsulfatase A-like enzyme
VVLHDLAAEAAIADREAPATVVLFGTPEAETFTEKGFFREDGEARGERYAWARREARVLFRWPETAPREAVVDLAPYPGVDGQAVDVQLNGVSVGRFEVPARGRHRVSLPVARQKKGENRLTFVFSRVAKPGSAHERRLAATVYSLCVAAEGEPFLDTLMSAAAPAPFAVTAAGGVPSLSLLGGSAVRYAIRMPAGGAALHFTPELHATARSARDAAQLRVTLETEAGERREIWKGDARSRDEVAVPLVAPEGTTLVLGVHADGGSGTWATFEAPRLVGPGPIPSLLRAPLAEGDARRGEPLARGLRGTNVVLIVLDAAGAPHFGCYGYGRPTTPAIDRLASEGVVFERAYTPAVFTLSAMGSLWTSLYPDEHHRGVPYDAPLPKAPLTIAELLGANGITTAGWVANGVAGPGFGLDRGFGEFEEVFREHGHSADAFAKTVPAWLEVHGESRFFAYLHFREPHFPFDPPPPFTTRFGPDGPLPRAVRADQGWIDKINSGRIQLDAAAADHLVRLYDGNLAFADQEVGRLRSILEGLGLWERTVVIVTADHGEGLLEHDFVGHNKQLYEESVHIPLIVRFPSGRGPAGLRIKALVDLLDVAPTVADIFGVLGKGGSDRAFAGRSLLSVAAGAPGTPAVFTRTATGERPSYAVRDGRFVYIRSLRYGSEELYDAVADPREKRKIAGRRPLETAYYRQLLNRWLASLRRGIDEEEGAKAQLTPEQLENLRALGYVQ